MKTSFFLLMLVISACAYQSIRDKENVTIRKNSSGRIVERWGNENENDNHMNFREFFYYDSTMLISKKYFSFMDENIECVIKDSMRYTEYKYEYKDNVMFLEKRFDPILNAKGEVTGHKLTYVHDVINNKEHVSSPTFDR